MQPQQKKPILPISLAVIGLLLMALGIYFGEAEKYFEKATMVCLQCIGIG